MDDRTGVWDAGFTHRLFGDERSATRTTMIVGGAVCAALVIGTVGYWLGRSGSDDPQATVSPQAPAQALKLPTPPTGLSVANASLSSTPYAPAPASAGAIPSPTVTVRTRQVFTRPFDPPHSASAIAPSLLVKNPVSGRAPSVPGNVRPTLPVVLASGNAFASRAPEPPAFARGGPSLAPSAGRAVVILRNDDAQAVEVTLDGNGTRTATLAPGASVPVPLDAGTYSLRAGSRGASAASAKLAVVGGQSYTLVVTRRKDGGEESLLILEPALDENAG